KSDGGFSPSPRIGAVRVSIFGFFFAFGSGVMRWLISFGIEVIVPPAFCHVVPSAANEKAQPLGPARVPLYPAEPEWRHQAGRQASTSQSEQPSARAAHLCVDRGRASGTPAIDSVYGPSVAGVRLRTRCKLQGTRPWPREALKKPPEAAFRP